VRGPVQTMFTLYCSYLELIDRLEFYARHARAIYEINRKRWKTARVQEKLSY